MHPVRLSAGGTVLSSITTKKHNRLISLYVAWAVKQCPFDRLFRLRFALRPVFMSPDLGMPGATSFSDGGIVREPEEQGHGTSENEASVLADWITRDDLATQLGVSPQTVKRWAMRREGPPWMKVGRKVLYNRDSVKEWLRSREIDPRGGRGR